MTTDHPEGYPFKFTVSMPNESGTDKGVTLKPQIVHAWSLTEAIDKIKAIPFRDWWEEEDE